MNNDFSKYHKSQGDAFPATEWNEFVDNLEYVVNVDNNPVHDVLVDGESCVTDKIANITGIKDLIKRLDSIPVNKSRFYVNNILTEPIDGVVKLPASADSRVKYELSGVLYGCIEIGDISDTTKEDTVVILRGVKIQTDKLHGISYMPTGTGVKSMNIIVAKDSVNEIVLTTDSEISDDQEACIHSNNNMKLMGCGYITCVNRGGHGIKASELLLSGHNHFYIEATHDAFHGGSKLDIDDGIFFINKANDAFGSGPTGKINVFGGKFYAYNILQEVFDSKNPGYFYCEPIVKTDVETVSTNMSNTINYPETLLTYKVLDVNKQEVQTGTFIEGETSYTPSDLTVSTYDKIEATITGHLTKPIIFPETFIKVTVNLNNAYIETETSCIVYSASGKSITIKSVKDSVNILKCTGSTVDDNYAIKSTNNGTIEVKSGSHLVLESVNGGAMYSSDLSIMDSSGTLIIRTCKDFGIQGTNVCIGSDVDTTKWGEDYFEGSILGYGDNSIKARLTSKGKKGDIVITEYFIGSLYATLAAATSIDLNKSKHVFYNTLTSPKVKNNISETYESYEYIPYRKIPVISK